MAATMDAPPVRYTRTSDGYDIAYVVGGQGPSLLYMPFHFNHAQRRWTGPMYARGMADRWRTYIYDSRGQGLSSRGLERIPSLDDYQRDLEAVVQANGLSRFAIAAYGGFAHVAIRYAVQHPDRVHALILICTSESFAAWPLVSMIPLAEENWDLFLEVTAPQGVSSKMLEIWMNFQKASVTQDDYVKLVKAFAASDIGDLLPRLSIPVLLLHSERQHWLSAEEGMKLAAKLPDASLVFLEGGAEPDDVQVAHAALQFLGDLPPLTAPGGEHREKPLSLLSSRQREVLHLVSHGKTNREIAGALVLSERTVQRHIANIYARIGVRNRSEATAFELGRANEP
jgi:pimeloyl-ACP methyl ester carboxylesterase/DNA-binding CsgD family transcriptional regulator